MERNAELGDFRSALQRVELKRCYNNESYRNRRKYILGWRY